MAYYAPFYRPTGYYNSSAPAAMPATPQYYQSNPQEFSDLIWVLNETEAMSYPVAIGNKAVLWDKSNDTVYIKSVDTQGVPSLRIMDYKERNAPERAKTVDNSGLPPSNGFVTLDAFNALQGIVDDLRGKLSSLEENIGKPKGKKDE